MPKLVVEKGLDKGRAASITQKMPVTVGRDATCALPLSDTMISRAHFRIEHVDDGYKVVDLGSMNGTLLNGQRVTEAHLETGDIIKAGLTVFAFTPDNATADPLIDQTFQSKYQVIERVGRGGMGTCYKANQIDLERIVALKVISEKNSENREFVDQFIKEARYSAALNHPNVVQVFEVGQDLGRAYYAMEFLPGGTVADRLARQADHKLDPAEAVEIALQIARALQYAHRKGIMHRDIKPENMLVSEAKQVKLSDLGLAQTMGEKIIVGERNYVLGTPHYIAPEIVRNDPFDFRSDIYSLGVCFYQMLTGHMPYEVETLKELVRKKLNEEAVPADRHVPSLPRSVLQVTMRMIRSRPEDRPGTIDEVIHELERIRKQLAGPAVPMRILLPMTAAALIVLAALVVIVATSRDATLPEPPKERLAWELFTTADAFEVKVMNRESVESIGEAIARYNEIIEKFPQTDHAAKSRARREKLLAMIRQLDTRRASTEADRRLQETLDLEDEAYPKFRTSVKEGRPDPTVFNDALTAYKALAEQPKFKGTPSGRTALERVDLIDRWTDTILTLKGRYEATREKVATLLPAAQFGRALQAWDDLLARIEEKGAPFRANPDPRYKVVFFDRIVEDARKATALQVSEAASSYLRQVDRLVELNDFDGAQTKLDMGRETYAVLEEIRAQFKARAAEITRARRAHEESEARRLIEEEQKLVALDREVFERMSRDIYEGYTRSFAFEDAIGRVVDQRLPRLKTEELEPRVQAKREQLRRAGLFLTAFVEAVNDPARKLNRNFAVPGIAIEGTLTRATREHLEIEVGGVQRTARVRFDAIEAWQIHYAVRQAWEIRDLEVQMNLVAFLLECGAPAEARTELAALAEHPDFAAARTFHTRCVTALNLKDPVDSLEVEAQKRFRAARSMCDAGEYARALPVLNELRDALKATELARSRQAEIKQMISNAKKRLAEKKDKEKRE